MYETIRGHQLQDDYPDKLKEAVKYLDLEGIYCWIHRRETYFLLELPDKIQFKSIEEHISKLANEVLPTKREVDNQLHLFHVYVFNKS